MDTTRNAVSNGAEGTADGGKGGRGCGCWIAALVVLMLVGGGIATVGAMTLLRTEKPLPLEREMTDLGKRVLMIPPEFADKRLPNSLRDPATNQPSATVIARGKQLFQNGDKIGGKQTVSCSMCHGPSGTGDSDLGIAMYPPANDLTQSSTRTKSDGQLFWLIAHGVNLTGMPAWGQAYQGPYTDNDVWSLVAFVRELPK